MSDEPGLPATDQEKAALLIRLLKATLQIDTAADGACIRAVLREIEEISPGEVEAMAARLQMRRLGLTTKH